MKTSTIIALIALIIAVAGAAIAVFAYLKKREDNALCGDLDDLDDLDELPEDNGAPQAGGRLTQAVNNGNGGLGSGGRGVRKMIETSAYSAGTEA